MADAPTKKSYFAIKRADCVSKFVVYIDGTIPLDPKYDAPAQPIPQVGYIHFQTYSLAIPDTLKYVFNIDGVVYSFIRNNYNMVAANGEQPAFIHALDLGLDIIVWDIDVQTGVDMIVGIPTQNVEEMPKKECLLDITTWHEYSPAWSKALHAVTFAPNTERCCELDAGDLNIGLPFSYLQGGTVTGGGDGIAQSHNGVYYGWNNDYSEYGCHNINPYSQTDVRNTAAAEWHGSPGNDVPVSLDWVNYVFATSTSFSYSDPDCDFVVITVTVRSRKAKGSLICYVDTDVTVAANMVDGGQYPAGAWFNRSCNKNIRISPFCSGFALFMSINMQVSQSCDWGNACPGGPYPNSASGQCSIGEIRYTNQQVSNGMNTCTG